MTNPDELESLARAATPGPWMHTPGYYNDSGGQYDQIDSPVEIISGEWGGPSGDNAAFIAAANPATILALLSANRETREREEALNEALTPSGDTKAAYHGEFTFQVTQWRENEDPDSDEEMEAYLADFTVPWDTVKEIMAAIKARSALTTQRGDGE